MSTSIMGNPMRHSQALKTSGSRLPSTVTAHQSKNASHNISGPLSFSELRPLSPDSMPQASSYVRDRLAARAQTADCGSSQSAPSAGDFLEEGPWNSQSACYQPRQPPQNYEAVAEQIGRLEPRDSANSDHSVSQVTPGGEDPQGRRQEDKSSAQRTRDETASPGKPKRTSYAEITKGAGTKGVKYGQASWRIGSADKTYFACMCCKHRVLRARLNNANPYTFAECAHVRDERSIRRGTTERHVRADDDQDEEHTITKDVHKELNGEAHRQAKEAAKRLGLQGRDAEIFQWREGIVFLHPTYEPIKHLINPHGLHDPELDMASLRAAEDGRSSLATSSIMASAGVAESAGPHHHPVTPSNQAIAPSGRSQEPVRRAVADRQKPQAKRARQRSPSSLTWAQVARGDTVILNGPGLRVDPFAQTTARCPGTAHQSPAQHYRCPPATKRPCGQDSGSIGPEQNVPWSQPHRQSQPALHPFPNSEYPPLPTTGFEFSLSGPGDHCPLPGIPDGPLSDIGPVTPHGGRSFDYSACHGAQSPDWALTRIPGHPPQVLSLPGPESSPLSSLQESAPSFTHGTGSSHTGYTSYYGPPTPGEPATPTPQPRQDFLGLCIDPRLLEKQPLNSVPENIDTDVLSEMEIPPAIFKHGSRRSGGRKRQ